MTNNRLMNSRARPRAHPTAAGLLLAALALTTVGTAAAAAPQGYAFTADEKDASVTRIDLASGERTRIDVPIAPHNVQVSGDGSTVLATGAPAGDGGHGDHDHGDGAGKLLVFEVADFAAGPRQVITVGDHPAHVVTDREGRHAFVTNAGDDSLSVVDLEAGTVTETIGTGAYPHGLRLSPDGRELHVANVEDGSVSVIDVAGRKEVARIDVGETPVQVGFTPAGDEVWVSLRNENRVAVIDVASREVVDRVDVGRWPIQVFAHPDGERMYVANEGTVDNPDNRVSVIDVGSREVVTTIEVGRGAHGLAMAGDAGYLLVTALFDNTLSVVDTATDSVHAEHAVGDGPNGVTWAAQTGSSTQQGSTDHGAMMAMMDECPMMGAGMEASMPTLDADTGECPMMSAHGAHDPDRADTNDSGDHATHH